MLDTTSLSIAAASISIVVLVAVLAQRRSSPKASRATTKVEPGVVVLHGWPGWKFSPNASPFVLRLETYLRLAGIPYVTKLNRQTSSKGKMPWIELDGEVLEDSGLIIDELERRGLGALVHNTTTLSEETRGACHGLERMLAEHTANVGVFVRWLENTPETVNRFMLQVPFPLRAIIVPMVIGNVRKSLWGQGLARHTPGDVHTMGCADFRALAQFLGTQKKFLAGDVPTRVDCLAFAVLTQWKCNPFAEYSFDMWAFIEKELPNLAAYYERVRETVFPGDQWEKAIENNRKVSPPS